MFGEAKFVLICGNVKDFPWAEARWDHEEHLFSLETLLSRMVLM